MSNVTYVDQTGDCSTKQEQKDRDIERYVCNFTTRGERRATKRRNTSTTM